ncbi:MAG TPA: beta-ketoacyl-[acyl-carrier-protein] synthase family protein [Planctomycetota bacterium]|nr:beta-ketoacyl-[acyl-carrier-protein] synthase family protein [Planctomycetota bacterium]HRR78753.1 beta-ketoacyl-[acyl-carrier-protein] synthase family protein [Planctomycetota bacterium]HRT95234.1 beta-ketoacyl-[acyl-carrier-protein] synthase family protein [Planctomycetota bacterium]
MPTSAPRLVITGLGAIAPNGNSVAEFWAGLCAGRDAVGPITHFDASPFRNTNGGEVRGFAFADPEASRAKQYALAAIEQALADARLEGEELRSAGIVLATNFGGCEHGEKLLAAQTRGETPDPRWLAEFDFQAAAIAAARRWGLRGPAATLSLSCASGVAAIGYAVDLIREGRCERAIAGGYDELALMSYSGLSALRAITPEIVRPFDKNRQGTIFSEGAGVILVEALDAARARGAAIHAEVLGHAMNNDAFHMTAPDTSGRGITAVMQGALDDAGVSPEDVQHVNAHGTGTPYNDKIETAAIKAVFNAHARRLVITANKSMIGHTCGAAGTLESIATIRTLQTGIVPPTIHYETPDPECDLDYVPNEARTCDVRVALCNAYGIGGTNSAIVLARWEGR